MTSTIGKRAIYSNQTKRPKALRVHFDGIPDEMKNEKRWVLWRLEWVKGKWTKVPYQGNRKASSTNPHTWSDLSSVKKLLEHGAFDGIGFVLGDGWAGVDLDEVVIGEDQFTNDAHLMMGGLKSHTEYSPSKTGMKIFGRGEWRGDWNKKQLPDGGDIEVYGAGRYFTVTGQKIASYPVVSIQRELDAIAKRYADETRKKKETSAAAITRSNGRACDDDQKLIDMAKRAKNGAKFSALWAGDRSGYKSPSEADLALCGMLGFWCGGDAGRVDSLFRQSGLYRDKWDRKTGTTTIGERTIDRALKGKTEFYKPGPTLKIGGTVVSCGVPSSPRCPI